MFDGFTGRQRKPASNLSTSEVIERIKKILDSEAREVRGKGKVVPHSIVLKMQWDKFATDDSDTIGALESELLIAAIDHINDRRYYTNAPMTIEVKPDFFTEGIRFIASFDPTSDREEDEREVHLSMPALDAAAKGEATDDTIEDTGMVVEAEPERVYICSAIFGLRGVEHKIKFRIPAPGRISIGRTAESMLSIDDVSISKHHATLAISANGEMAVADTGSTNGTKVNGEKIAYGEAVAIAESGLVTFGTVEVKFSLEPEVREPIPAEPKDDDADKEQVEE
ncbi:MAG TPA: FHA domain-containing protein [Pyrinomonadaceae bacterium]|nr:FHA domain-containing protein [Pyrinomonadaceae bacterium]